MANNVQGANWEQILGESTSIYHTVNQWEKTSYISGTHKFTIQEELTRSPMVPCITADSLPTWTRCRQQCSPPHLQTPSHVLSVTYFTSMRRTGNGSVNSGVQRQLRGCLVPPVMFGGGEESWRREDVFPGFVPLMSNELKLLPKAMAGDGSRPQSAVNFNYSRPAVLVL